MSNTALRLNHRELLKIYPRQTLLQALIMFGGQFGSLITSVLFGSWLIQEYPREGWLMAPLLAFFIATRWRGLNNIIHECSHNGFVESLIWNRRFGDIACALMVKSFQAYRVQHQAHHGYLGDYRRDLDFKALKDFHLEKALTVKQIFIHCIRPLFWWPLRPYLSFDIFPNEDQLSNVTRLIWWVLLLGFAIWQPISFALFIVIPLLWLLPAIHYWTDCIDHGGIYGSEVMEERSRNFIVPKAIRWLLFPRNDCFHQLHHVLPTLPVQHYDKVWDLLTHNSTAKGAQILTHRDFHAINQAVGN